MNWDRGFRRITLVLSIIGAVVGAGLSFYYGDAKKVLTFSEESLARERRAEFDEDKSSSLIHFWKDKPPVAGANTASENDRLWWKAMTGLELREEPWWLKARMNDRVVGESEQEQKARVSERLRKLELLKEQGWHTANGESLALTPEEAWPLRHRLQIEYLESQVRQRWIEVLLNTAMGALCGFFIVWTVYVATWWPTIPLLMWITQGFRENKQKNGQQTNESGSAGDC